MRELDTTEAKVEEISMMFQTTMTGLLNILEFAIPDGSKAFKLEIRTTKMVKQKCIQNMVKMLAVVMKSLSRTIQQTAFSRSMFEVELR